MQDPSNVQHTSNKSTTEGETFTNVALTRSKMMTSSRQNSVTQQLWLRTLVPSHAQTLQDTNMFTYEYKHSLHQLTAKYPNRLQTSVHTCLYVHTRVRAHARTHTHTHTHIQTQHQLQIAKVVCELPAKKPIRESTVLRSVMRAY